MPDQPAFTRVTRTAELDGKTIEFSMEDVTWLGLRFTDRTYFVAVAREEFDGDSYEPELSVTSILDSTLLLHLGIITQDEWKMLNHEQRERERLGKVEARRQEYLKLKAEFDTHELTGVVSTRDGRLLGFTTHEERAAWLEANPDNWEVIASADCVRGEWTEKRAE